MKEKILSLEKASCALEPDSAGRKTLRERVIAHTEEFLGKIEHDKAYFKFHTDGSRIKNSDPGQEIIPIEEIIDRLRTDLDEDGINPASGGHLGYIPGGGIYASSLADYWAAITNRYAGVFYANPGAVRIENQLIRWLCELIGFPEQAHGNLTSGGSVANLIGIVVARSAMDVRAREIPETAIYMTRQGHHSLDKALKVAALHECQIRFVKMDDKYRMDLAALEEQIRKDKSDGIRPFLLLGSAGTTDVGAVDPLDQMADLAKKYGMWFHVDAAYGGFFSITEEVGDKFKGMERADSVCIDPHKGLFLPYGLGVCLVREGSEMKKAFAFQASYLQDTVEAVDEINPMDVSPEMTKHFRGLRLWIPIMLYGIEPFRACLSEKLWLARYFHEEIGKVPGFVAGPEPELSVVTFRYVPENGDANEFNKALIEEVHKDGRVFFSSTTIDGNYTLRLAILAFRTHLSTIDLTLEVLKEKVSLLLQSSPSTLEGSEP